AGDAALRSEAAQPSLRTASPAASGGAAGARAAVSGDEGGASAASALAGNRTIVLATVEGDIHDIGKNIVKMLLENYGFPVVDLGRDVPPACVVEAAREHGARLVGLSALMTTTVKAMERTIALVREQLPGVAVMVGGAVLTQDYAAQIGADFYAKDAAESARIATRFFEE
ncbi:MAG: cobalamin-dependent protein, partial [Eggerthellaceae bacterium]|nr:cobalamin-dependent protein [Eggerthellaceae bacterium]